MPSPSDRLYTRTHEWIKIDGGQAVVGLTEFAVHAIKDIVFIELPKAGKALEGGRPFGVVESVKAVFDLNAPLSGTVTQSNAALEADFAPLASDPYEGGWLLKMADLAGERGALLDAGAYDRFCAEEHH
jgi:glycine cleavage system H protein